MTSGEFWSASSAEIAEPLLETRWTGSVPARSTSVGFKSVDAAPVVTLFVYDWRPFASAVALKATKRFLSPEPLKPGDPDTSPSAANSTAYWAVSPPTPTTSPA